MKRMLFAFFSISVTLLAHPVAAEEKTTYWGPVVLHEDSRFEVCANAKATRDETITTVSFVRVRDGKSLVKEVRLSSAKGGCFSLDYKKAGDSPVIAIVDAYGEPGDVDLVASAAIINGIFESPAPREFTTDQGMRTLTTFGPLRLNPGKRVEVCATNLRNNYAVPVSVSFFSTKDSERAFVEAGPISLEKGKGTCFSVSEEQVGQRSFFAQVSTDPVEPGFENGMVFSGAFVINGIFNAPIPASSVRYIDIND